MRISALFFFFCCLLFSLPTAEAKTSSLLLLNQHDELPVLPAELSANEYLEKIVKDEQMAELNDYLVDFAQLNGLVFIDKDHQLQKDPNNLSNHFSVTEPMTVFPSPFPKELYDMARKVQPLMARVHLHVSLDYQFLKEAMERVAKADKFIGRMMDIVTAVKKEGRLKRHIGSGITLILQRSDYLSHQETRHGKNEISLKQIEVNSGIAKAQGSNPFKAHQRVLDKIKYMGDDFDEKLKQPWLEGLNVEPNNSIEGQAKALYQAWLAFAKLHDAPEALILLISAPKRRFYSHFEQLRWNQFELEDIARAEGAYRPQVVQITIEECMERLELDPDTHHLMLNGHKPSEHKPEGHKRRIGVAIFLDGYLAEHFPRAEGETKEEAGNKAWAMRLSMEQSTAVLSPNASVFLAGTKKVQQVLTEPDRLEHLFRTELSAEHDPWASLEAKEAAKKLREELNELRSTFMDQWALGEDTQEERELVAKALERPDEYVLKGNQQSGKDIHIGAELKAELGKYVKNHEARGAYILQRRIRPFAVKNVVMPIPAIEKKAKKVAANEEDQVKKDEEKEEKTSSDDEPVKHKNSRGKRTIVASSPVPSESAQAAKSKFHFVDVNSELSIFGSLLTQTNALGGQNVIVDSSVDGYMVRSMLTSKNKCNVSSGGGGFDSFALFSLKDFLKHNHASSSHDDQTSVSECSMNGPPEEKDLL